jgi:hypothetical protein
MRRSNMAFTYGELEMIYNENGVLVFGRKYFNRLALVVFSKHQGAEALTIELPKHFQNTGYVPLKSDGISCDGKSIRVDAKSSGYQVFSK